MNLLRTRSLMPLALCCSVAIAGCGGGSKSTSSTAGASATTATTSGSGSGGVARDVFIQSLAAGLPNKGNLPPDYSKCVVDRAKAEVTNDQIQRLISLSAAQRSVQGQAIGRGLGAECIKQGAGLKQFKAIYLQTLSKTLNQNAALPASFKSCVMRKASATPDSTLSALFAQYAGAGSAGAAAKGRAIGQQMGKQCLAGK